MQPVTLLIIPVLASAFWPVVMILSRRRFFKAQWMMALTQMLIGASVALYDAYYGGLIHNSYVADVMYTLVSVFCAPAFYIFVCSLSCKDGVSRRQRQIFMPAVLFILLFSALIIVLGGERYERYMTNVVDARDFNLTSSTAYSAMVVLGCLGYRILIAGQTLLVVVLSVMRISRYHKELALMGRIPSKARYVHYCSFLSMPILCMLALFPHRLTETVSPWMVVLVVALSVMQLLVGYYAYIIRFTAEHLEIMRKEDELSHLGKEEQI